jgi:hypothetical protein
VENVVVEVRRSTTLQARFMVADTNLDMYYECFPALFFGARDTDEGGDLLLTTSGST